MREHGTRKWTAAVLAIAAWVGWLELGAQERSKPGSVDLDRSRVYIFVGKTGFGHEHGVVGQLQSGQVLLGSGKDAGSLVFDMKTFSADSKEARKYVGLSGETDADTRKQVDANMLGKDVLNVAKFPTATFQIKSALPAKAAPGNKASTFTLDGAFTLHGVEKPLKLVCTASPTKEGWHVTTKFKVRQTDFGITPFSKALGAVGVADELVIFGDLMVAAEPR
jgi:polyisoprenoid-binding protein YceI